MRKSYAKYPSSFVKQTHSTQALLLPVRPYFIWGTVLLALLLNMAQNVLLFGNAAWVPDLLALALVFWTVHQPHRLGLGTAFVLGLLMDAHATTLLGQHALVYTLLCFSAKAMHRRLLWFSLPWQTVQVLPLFIFGYLIEFLVRWLAGTAGLPTPGLLLAPFVQAGCWPVISYLLLLPQRRPPDPDKTRPL
jgi:rod shape-determining protein MreD